MLVGRGAPCVAVCTQKTSPETSRARGVRIRESAQGRRTILLPRQTLGKVWGSSRTIAFVVDPARARVSLAQTAHCSKGMSPELWFTQHRWGRILGFGFRGLGFRVQGFQNLFRFFKREKPAQAVTPLPLAAALEAGAVPFLEGWFRMPSCAVLGF